MAMPASPLAIKQSSVGALVNSGLAHSAAGLGSWGCVDVA
jgi:hypothetical protein